MPGVGNQRSGESLDQRRLTGAVVADDREHLARKQVDVDTVKAYDLPKVLINPRPDSTVSDVSASTGGLPSPTLLSLRRSSHSFRGVVVMPSPF